MKICLAQTHPVRGDIKSNIEKHKKFIELAVANGADMIIFPELSLTGYEPTLAKELATNENDHRLNDFQEISDTHNITIGLGLPTRSSEGTCISMVLFQPNKSRQVYSKKYLHADEEPYFVSGQNFSSLLINQTNIGFAICYELSVPQHAEDACNSGATIYIASVAKTAGGVEKAVKRLSEIANKYSLTVLMANCVGICEDGLSAGKTSVWDNKGLLKGNLDDAGEGVLIFDTETQKLIDEKL
jgi:predicted amidohydrolase